MTAAANPLRGSSLNSACVASLIDQIPGPVLAVGHSYGGAVISNAASMAKNVVGLVFIAAFAPDEGELLGAVTSGSKDSVLNTALVPLRYPTGDGAVDKTVVEFAIHPAKIHDAFAAELPVGATQRPVAELAFSEPTRRSAWKHCLVGRWSQPATRAAGTDVVRSIAERASATITGVGGSHVIMVSQPQVVCGRHLERGRAHQNRTNTYLCEDMQSPVDG